MSPRTRARTTARSRSAAQPPQASAPIHPDTPVVEMRVRDLVALLSGQVPLSDTRVSDPRVDQLVASIAQLQSELAALKRELKSR